MDYNKRYPEEQQKEIFEEMLNRKKTRQRPKGMTNPAMRDAFPIIKEKWPIWATLFRLGLHFRDWDKIKNIDQVVDNFFQQSYRYMVVIGIIEETE